MNIHVGTFISVYTSSFLYARFKSTTVRVYVQRLTNEYDERKKDNNKKGKGKKKEKKRKKREYIPFEMIFT